MTEDRLAELREIAERVKGTGEFDPAEALAAARRAGIVEKPLHVRVAEALGWFRFEPSPNGMWPEEWRGLPPTPIVGEPSKEVPRYDTDWSATGPLIEKHMIVVEDNWHYVGKQSERSGTWTAHTRQGIFGSGSKPLIAICNLILALKEAGKL